MILVATTRNRSASSLTEVVGILAILTIIAALVIPRLLRRENRPAQVQGIVHDAHVEEALVGIRSLEAGAMEHYARFGSLGMRDGSSENTDRYDGVLLQEGFLTKPFRADAGTRSKVRLVNVSGLSSTARVGDVPGAYDLDGDGDNDVVGNNYVVEVVISGVTDAEAKGLNNRLDGSSLGPASNGSDFKGRVIWNGTSAEATREVHIYITQGR